jgi:hypothetical protein
MKMNDETSSAILYIKGVYLEDLYVNQDDCDTDDNTDDESEFDIVPTTFTDISDWVFRTSVRCINCGLEHDNPPVPIPNYMTTKDDITTIQLERVLGCGFACAMTHLIVTYTGDNLDKRTYLLKYIYRKFTGVEIHEIPRAPYRHEIDVYGGSSARYTETKFRAYVNRMCPAHEYLLVGDIRQKSDT